MIKKNEIPERWQKHYDDPVVNSYLYEKYHTKGRLGAAVKSQASLVAQNPKVGTPFYIDQLKMYNNEVNSLSTRLTEIDRSIDLHLTDKKGRLFTIWTPIITLLVTVSIFVYSEKNSKKEIEKNLRISLTQKVETLTDLKVERLKALVEKNSAMNLLERKVVKDFEEKIHGFGNQVKKLERINGQLVKANKSLKLELKTSKAKKK